MTQQFTASEVRDLAKRGTDAMQQFIDGRHTLHIPPQYDDADMVIAECLRAMDAFADLLEAREREDSRSLNLNAIVSATRGALAAHSAQAQPPAASVTDAMVDRAQDCLHDKGKDIGYYHMRAALEAALAAHYAQAQPQASSLPFSRAQFRQALMDAGVVKREAIDDSVNYDGGLTRDNVGSSYCALQMLAAQENPNG